MKAAVCTMHRPIFPGNPNASAPGSPITVPSNAPVTGVTMGWYQGRVYAPSATLDGDQDLTVILPAITRQNRRMDWATIAPLVA